MKTGYYFVSVKDKSALTNLDVECIRCATSCHTRNELYECEILRELRRRGKIKFQNNELYLCTNEEIKSKRGFKEKQRIFIETLLQVDIYRQELSNKFSLTTSRLIHNLVSLNAQSIQSIFNLIPQDEFLQPSREDLLAKIEERVRKDPQAAALLIIDLLKNENLVKTEFSVYRKVFENESITELHYHIHKIVLLVLNSFWDEFTEKKVSFEIGQCYDKVYVDYDVVAASLVHVLENAAKYILPNSKLKIRFQHNNDAVTIIFDMISLKVEPDEIDKIFEEGYSGKNPTRLGKSGKGLGLYLVRKLLSLTGGEVSFKPDVDPSQRIKQLGIDFVNNIFIINLPTWRENN